MSSSIENRQDPNAKAFIRSMWKLLLLACAVLAASVYVQSIGVEQTKKNLLAMAQKAESVTEQFKLELPMAKAEEASERRTAYAAKADSGPEAEERVAAPATTAARSSPLTGSDELAAGQAAVAQELLDLLEGPLGKLMGLSMLLVGLAVAVSKADFVVAGISVVSSSALMLTPTLLRQLI